MRGAGPWLQQTGKRAEVASIVSRMFLYEVHQESLDVVSYPLPDCSGSWVLLLLTGCTSGGDQGQATAPSAPSPRVERQAIDNLLALYQEAVVAEDSDRLQALLAPATALAQTTTALAPGPAGILDGPDGLAGHAAGHLSAGHRNGPGHPA